MHLFTFIITLSSAISCASIVNVYIGHSSTEDSFIASTRRIFKSLAILNSLGNDSKFLV